MRQRGTKPPGVVPRRRIIGRKVRALANGKGSAGVYMLIPILQAIILLACIVSVTLLGRTGTIDSAAVTGIIGAVVGSIGTLAAVRMTQVHENERTGNGPA